MAPRPVIPTAPSRGGFWIAGAADLGTTPTVVASLRVGTTTILLQVTDDGALQDTDTVLITVVAGTPQDDVTICGSSLTNRGDNVSWTMALTNTSGSTLTTVQLTLNVSPSNRVKDLSPGSTISVADVPVGGSISQTWSGRSNRNGTATVTGGAFSEGASLGTASMTLTVQK